MNSREEGFLLLTSQLGDPERKPLSVAQLRQLAASVRSASIGDPNREMGEDDLVALGYQRPMARRILHLLADRELLEYYLHMGKKAGCQPITRASESYPLRVRKQLGDDSPGCLWAKGDLSLLERPCISLVGSRDLGKDNREFARMAGREAARQGYVLVSGNARGADKTAQEACLGAGGQVICVVADRLCDHSQKENVLYLSEDGFDSAFSAFRALSRNRIIHSLSPVTLVAQATYGSGGTWHGTERNLRFGWSGVCCFDDESRATEELKQMGAAGIRCEQLADLPWLCEPSDRLF